MLQRTIDYWRKIVDYIKSTDNHTVPMADIYRLFPEFSRRHSSKIVCKAERKGVLTRPKHGQVGIGSVSIDSVKAESPHKGKISSTLKSRIDKAMQIVGDGQLMILAAEQMSKEFSLSLSGVAWMVDKMVALGFVRKQVIGKRLIKLVPIEQKQEEKSTHYKRMDPTRVPLPAKGREFKPRPIPERKTFEFEVFCPACGVAKIIDFGRISTDDLYNRYGQLTWDCVGCQDFCKLSTLATYGELETACRVWRSQNKYIDDDDD